jgi:REP element-mobilizing transposase RayT
LHAFMGGIACTLGGVPEAVGGVSDQVHLMVGLRATHCLSDVMRELKSVSSRWVHEAPGLSRFAWQESYGAFPVSQSQRVTLRRYIGEPGGALSYAHVS